MAPESANVSTQDACEADGLPFLLLPLRAQGCELGYESTLEEARPEDQVQTVLSKVKGSC